jgi:hypothetical protein
LTATELEAETLVAQLDQLQAEHKRAKTIRYEFQVYFCINIFRAVLRGPGCFFTDLGKFTIPDLGSQIPDPTTAKTRERQK